jgi:sugar lactone lactonase YvrE
MTRTLLAMLVLAHALGCAVPGEPPEGEVLPSTTPQLEIIAESERQWTGVAVTREGRIFVNFPRWSPEVPLSVAEVLDDGSLLAFPDTTWNQWAPGLDPASHWVCVQSVVADGKGSLWVLDPASPGFGGVVPGGAKLVEFDALTGELLRVIVFPDDVAPETSYLNDVRIDHEHNAAYLTDSGDGALVVVDLATDTSRRLLAGHPATSAEETVLTIEGIQWLLPDGTAPQVHADGIAYDAVRDLVYFQALTGRTLYRIPGAALRDPELDDAAHAASVEKVASSGPSDGLLWDGSDGVFISAIEDDAVKRWRPDGSVEIVVQDPLLAWPDSFALGAEGALYVTTSQIHRGPETSDPYRILRARKW